ncbi:MAG: ABC transporter permease [Hyphomicrobiaceae bacterium]
MTDISVTGKSTSGGGARAVSAPASGASTKNRTFPNRDDAPNTGRQLSYLLVPAGLLLAWGVTDVLRPQEFSFFPTLRSVVLCIADWIFNISGGKYFFSGMWLTDLAYSMARVIGGLVLGSMLAILVGLGVLWVPASEKLIDPIVQMLRPIPKTAFLPFAILLFGLGNGPALFMIVYGVFLIVYVQVIMSIKLVPVDFRRASRMLGASQRQVLTTVVLPYALPGICGGIRIGASYAWLILILAEMLAVREGFGYTLWYAYEFMRMDVVVASMIMIGILGFLTDKVILNIMKRQFIWAEEIAQANV